MGRPATCLSQKQLDRAPTQAELANNIGFVHFKLGHFDEALRWFDTTLKLDPWRSVAFINQADVFEATHQKDKAVAALKRCLAQDPTAPSGSAVRARLERLTGKKKR